MNKYSNMSIEELENEIEKHNFLYWKENSPIISDEEYDLIVEELKNKNPDSKLLIKIQDQNTYGNPVKHEIPMLSMNKNYDLESMQKWAKGLKSKYFIVSSKMDGTALSIIYQHGDLYQASTRGSGMVGEDVTENVKRIKNVPNNISNKNRIEVRGEVVMPLSVFNARYSDTNSNARNLAAGSLKQKKSEESEKRDLVFYAYNILGTDKETEEGKFQYLEEIGFKTVSYKKIEIQDFEKEFDRINNEKFEYDYEIDGVIYCVNDVKTQNKVGNTSHHPRYACAWKIQGEKATTTLKDVIWSVSRNGIATPVAIVEPVELSGAIVSKCTVHHANWVKKLGLKKGCTIEMVRAGGVIPKLLRVTEDKGTPIEVPKEIDGIPTYMDGDFLKLSETENHPDVIVGKLKHFVKVLEMDGFGDKIVQGLFENRLVKEFNDFYTIRKDDMITSLDRMGEKTATNLLKEVDKKRKLTLDVFLRSLGIDELGKHVSKVLLKEFKTLNKIMELEPEELNKIDSIGPIIAHKVCQGLKDHKDLMERLLEHIEVIEPEINDSGTLSGKSFVFTGSLTLMGRKEAQKKVKDLGGETPSGVKKDLDYLVCGEDSENTSKRIKAEKYNSSGANIKIITEKEFSTYLN